MQRQYIALSAMVGAVALGAILGTSTPTMMLDKDDGDWRSTLPAHATGYAWLQVGSAPESAELGRRPLDPALLAGASYAGDTVVLSEAADAELHGATGPRTRLAQPVLTIEPSPATATAPESEAMVAVQYGTAPKLSEQPSPADLPDAAPLAEDKAQVEVAAAL